jgi:shikimate kinase
LFHLLSDKPENILKWIIFYDVDSKLIEKCLTSSEKRLYLSEIKKDITYYRKKCERAHLRVDISGLDPKQAIEMFESQETEQGKSEQTHNRRKHENCDCRSLSGNRL